MHPDESRDQDTYRNQVLADFVSDPQTLRAKYFGLIARESQLRDKVAQLEARAKLLERDLKQQRSRATQVPDLTRRLGSAHGSLDAYRAETRRLKEDLARLRGSRALRISRAISGSAQSLKRSLTGVRESPEPTAIEVEVEAPAEAAVPPPSGVVAESLPLLVVPGHEAEPGLWDKLPSQCTYEELKQRLDERPSAQALGYVINRAWFAHGLIEEPGTILDSWPELASGLSAPMKQLVGRIQGARRLGNVADWIPARSSGIAYVAERDRLMYCVHSTPAYNSNGYSTRTRGVAAAIVANGVEVRVVARAGYPWDAKIDTAKPPHRRSVTAVDSIDYVHLTGPNENHDPQDRVILQMADAFVREARLYRPSKIQAASNFRTGLASLIAARRLGLPFVYEVRGLWELTEASAKMDWDQSDRYALAKRLETLVANEADHVLAITQEVADELIRRGVEPQQISLLPNGVDQDQFTPLYADEQMRSRFTPHPSGETDLPTIGFAGSMVDYEGLDHLLEASQLLHQRGILHHVVLAGSGAAEPSLQKFVQEKELEHVTFLGRLPAGDIPRLLSVIDVVVCPRKSTLITELVSPLKPLEAMSAGRATVVSNVRPNHAIAGMNRVRGILHRADDPEDLAAALHSLLQDPDARRDLGRHARRWVLSERTWSHLGKRMVRAHASAAVRYRAVVDTASRIPLRELRVAVVADEFTTATLAAEVAVTSLERERWADQLDDARPHLVFIESAWAIGKDWHRGVGFYSDEEHADFRALVDSCRASGIPTVFWNKEDPVHFNRFVRAAAECDHIFTTDADTIPRYLAAATHAKTASALPFYAAPTIHNPLPGSLSPTGGTSYAGTFYGDRYATRSKELSRLLSEAAPFGLTIYDRQADTPDSPYRFPPHLQRYVVGSLPYSQVLDAYKAHTANLNVNSVADSPSMFSRRVVEVAASGAVALSAPGRGITETFGSAIACSEDSQDWRAWLRAWSTSPEARRNEAWLQMRAALRAHTCGTALTIVARTAGLPVEAPALPEYVAVVHGCTEETLTALAAQSVLPTTVFIDDAESSAAAENIFPSFVEIRLVAPEPARDRCTLHVYSSPDRSAAEDLLCATRWGQWSWVSTSPDLDPLPPYALPSVDAAPATGLTLLNPMAPESAPGLMLSRPTASVDVVGETQKPTSPIIFKGLRLLVAGHDLKFASGLMSAAERSGASVMIDQWSGHAQHDEAVSRPLLEQADVVFCEWGLGNAVWYSKNVKPHQRLVVRVHQQELRLDYLRSVKYENVDAMLFVGRTVLESAVVSHGVPRDKARIVPNYVDTQHLLQPKSSDDARFTLGLVGPLPRHKRLDLALDLTERLHLTDERYRLRVKGKRPEELAWLSKQASEQSYFVEQLARIDEMNNRFPGIVHWDPHGKDVPDWLTNIGVVLSVSDMESFHYTIADGAASGSLPVILAWPGAEYLYPHDWLCSDLDEMEQRILTASPEGAASFIEDHFSMDTVMPHLLDHIRGDAAQVQGLR